MRALVLEGGVAHEVGAVHDVQGTRAVEVLLVRDPVPHGLEREERCGDRRRDVRKVALELARRCLPQLGHELRNWAVLMVAHAVAGRVGDVSVRV